MYFDAIALPLHEVLQQLIRSFDRHVNKHDFGSRHLRFTGLNLCQCRRVVLGLLQNIRIDTTRSIRNSVKKNTILQLLHQTMCFVQVTFSR